jgi:hypothetical protein
MDKLALLNSHITKAYTLPAVFLSRTRCVLFCFAIEICEKADFIEKLQVKLKALNTFLLSLLSLCVCVCVCVLYYTSTHKGT